MLHVCDPFSRRGRGAAMQGEDVDKANGVGKIGIGFDRAVSRVQFDLRCWSHFGEFSFWSFKRQF